MYPKTRGGERHPGTISTLPAIHEPTRKEKLPASVAPPADGERGGLCKVGAQREQGKVNPRSPAGSVGQQKPFEGHDGDVGATSGAQRGL